MGKLQQLQQTVIFGEILDSVILCYFIEQKIQKLNLITL